jgi:hypothetical protein
MGTYWHVCVNKGFEEVSYERRSNGKLYFFPCKVGYMKYIFAITSIFLVTIIMTAGCIGGRLGTVAYSESSKSLDPQKLPSSESQNNNLSMGAHCEKLHILSKKVITGDFPDRRIVNAIRMDIADNQYFISLTSDETIYQNINEKTTINATVISDPYYGQPPDKYPNYPTIIEIFDGSC